MDKPRHSRLSKALERAAEQEAQMHPLPEQLWQQIAQELTPSREAAGKVQQAFEQQVQPALPPVDLWGGIAEQLDHNKIKSSFEKQVTPEAPFAVWDDISEQLEIESVWKQVLRRLNKRSSWIYWREKAVQIGLIALVLLWLRGCDWGRKVDPITTPVTPIASTSSTTDQGTTSTNNKYSNTFSEKNTTVITKEKNNNEGENKEYVANHNKENKVAYTTGNNNPSIALTEIYGHTTTTELNKIPSVNKAVESNGAVKAIESNVSYSTVLSSNHAAQNKTAPTNKVATSNTTVVDPLPATSVISSSTLTKETASSETPTKNSVPIGKEVLETLTPLGRTKVDENSSTLPIDKYIITLAKNQERNDNDTAATEPTNKATQEPPALWNVATAKLAPLQSPKSLTNRAVLALQALDLKKVQQARQRQQRHLEVGLQARVKGTFLLGNKTSEALERNSLVKTKVMPTAGVGANLAWYATRKDALIVAMHPMANSRQYFGGYSKEGRYYHQEIRLSYFEAELAYQRTLLAYNEFGGVPSSVYARINYGFGYLSKAETVVNGLATEELGTYNNTNHSFGLSLGNTHRLQRWVIDYGLYGQLGLSTVHQQQPTEYSHLLNLGAYIGLRYVL